MRALQRGLGRQPSDVVAGRLLFWIRGDQGVLGMMSGPTLVLVDALGAPLAALSLLNRPVTWANALADVFYVHYTLDDGPIEASRGAITATDAHTGRLHWELDAELCTTVDFAIAEDRLLCGHAERNGTPPCIVAVDLHTGAELSRTPLDSPARILLVRERELFVRTVNTDYVFDLRS